VVHVMQPKVRDYYQIERLWKVDIGRPKPGGRVADV
jgi:ribosomal silencing factor RsfS